MLKHTVGPWWRFGGMVDGYGIASDSGTILEQGCYGLHNEANARLIAASPKLLKALEMIASAERSDGAYDKHDMAGAIVIAQRAIDEVKGGL